MKKSKKYTKLQVTKGEKVFHTLTCDTLKEAQEIMKLMTISEDQFFLITPMLDERPIEAYIYRANHQHV